jgi:hypothetical protein
MLTTELYEFGIQLVSSRRLNRMGKRRSSADETNPGSHKPLSQRSSASPSAALHSQILTQAASWPSAASSTLHTTETEPPSRRNPMNQTASTGTRSMLMVSTSHLCLT